MMTKAYIAFALSTFSAVQAMAAQRGDIVIATMGTNGFEADRIYAQSDNAQLIKPSVLTSTISPYGTGPQTLDLVTSCIIQPQGVIAPNCKVTLNWNAVNGTGGHAHNTNRPPGIMKTANNVTAGSTGPGPAGTLNDNTGPAGSLFFTYTAPEASGVVAGSITGVALVNGVSTDFGPIDFSIDVAFQGLQKATIGGLAINYSSTRHGDNNGNASPETIAALGVMVQRFSDNLTTEKLATPVLRVTALALPSGGIFDVGQTQWRKPHVTHRFGDDADIGMAGLKKSEKTALQSALREALFSMPVRSESPANPSASHWHLRLK